MRPVAQARPFHAEDAGQRVSQAAGNPASAAPDRNAFSTDAAAVGGSGAGGVAPAFTPQEHGVVAGWADAMAEHGLRIEAHADLFEGFAEILMVSPTAHDEPLWLVHKTPAGDVAVRLWPGLADIVPTLAEALAMVIQGAARQRRRAAA